MRNLLFCIGVSMISGAVHAQSITLAYDAAGNRTKRFSEAPLPVTLSDFQVLRVENVAQLLWSTTYERDFSHFEVEWSTGGLEWELIGRVESKRSNQSVPVGYEFLDQTPRIGRNYYRLKMTDHDGTFVYSKIQSLYFDPKVAVYPNPVYDFLRITGSEAFHRFEIVAMDGKVIHTSDVIPSAGIDCRGLPFGLYILNLHRKSGGVEVIKIAR